MAVIKSSRTISKIIVFMLIFISMLLYLLTNNLLPIVISGILSIIIVFKEYKIQMYDIIVIFLPVMFYIKVPFTINTSMADFILPFLLWKYFAYKSNNIEEKKVINIILKYGLILMWVM